MRRILAITLIALALPSAAFAKYYKLGRDAPIAWVSFPEKWVLKEFKNGVETQSAEGLHILVKAVKSVDGAKLSKDALTYLETLGVKINKVVEQSQDTDKLQINGLDYAYVDFDAKDKKGGVAIELTFIDMSKVNGHMLLVMAWGAASLTAKNLPGYEALFKSIKPISKK